MKRNNFAIFGLMALMLVSTVSAGSISRYPININNIEIIQDGEVIKERVPYYSNRYPFNINDMNIVRESRSISRYPLRISGEGINEDGNRYFQLTTYPRYPTNINWLRIARPGR